MAGFLRPQAWAGRPFLLQPSSSCSEGGPGLAHPEARALNVQEAMPFSGKWTKGSLGIRCVCRGRGHRRGGSRHAAGERWPGWVIEGSAGAQVASMGVNKTPCSRAVGGPLRGTRSSLLLVPATHPCPVSCPWPPRPKALFPVPRSTWYFPCPPFRARVAGTYKPCWSPAQTSSVPFLSGKLWSRRDCLSTRDKDRAQLQEAFTCTSSQHETLLFLYASTRSPVPASLRLRP